MPKLWNPALRCFNGCDLLTGRRLDMPVSAGFLPLFAGLADNDQAGQMAEELERWRRHARYLVPSLAPDHPLFEPQRYWRGPVWSIVNYMIALGLRDYGFIDLAAQIQIDVLTLTEQRRLPRVLQPARRAGLRWRKLFLDRRDRPVVAISVHALMPSQPTGILKAPFGTGAVLPLHSLAVRTRHTHKQSQENLTDIGRFLL